MSKPKQSPAAIIKNLAFMLGLVWRASPARFIISFVDKLFSSLFGTFYSVILIAYIIDSLDKKRSFAALAVIIIAVAALQLLVAVLLSAYDRLYKRQSTMDISAHIHRLLFKKAAEADLACYEDPAYYDKFTKASNEANDRAMQVLDTASDFIGNLAGIGAITAYIVAADPVILLFTVVSITSSLVLGGIQNKMNYRLNMEQVPYDRRKNYVNRTVFLNTYAKELRLSNIFTVLGRILDDSVKAKIEIIRKYAAKRFALNFSQNILNSVVMLIGSLLYIAYRAVVRKSLVIGAAAAMLNAINQQSWQFFKLFEAYNKFGEHSLYIQNLRDFLDRRPDVSSGSRALPADGAPKELRFENVSFTYAGASAPSLKNINLTVHPGERLALVGENGAGKSTLVKLAMRLYDPCEGRITYGGEDIRELRLEDYRALFATVFQDFQVFALTLADNVLMRRSAEGDEELAARALRLSGLYEKVEGLPLGARSNLTREFDKSGAVLSGGEGQKLALARIFARDCAVVILDEPSSALDPVAEARMYVNMARASEGRTVLFISHRLSSTKDSDRIILLSGGGIAEEGTHEELMALRGRYALMFGLQAERYVAAAKEGAL